MNSLNHLSTDRTYRRLSAAAIGAYAAIHAQDARLLALEGVAFEPAAPRAPLWDEGLLDRLTQPLSRIRE